MFPARATYPTYLNLLDMVTLIIGYLVRGANYDARMYSTVGHALCVCVCVCVCNFIHLQKQMYPECSV